MSEFYRPTQEEPTIEFQEKLDNAGDEAEVDGLVEQKAKEILAEMRENTEVKSEPENLDLILDQYIPLFFKGNDLSSENINNISNVLYSEIQGLEEIANQDKSIEFINYISDRIRKVTPTINESLETLEQASLEAKNHLVIEYRARLLDYKKELLLLEEQLTYHLNQNPFVKDKNIKYSLDKYRDYRVKLEELESNSNEIPDIKGVMELYAQHIKNQFSNSPEKYGIGRAKAFKLDINKLVNEFTEVESTKDQVYRQRDIVEAKSIVIKELSQTPGVVGVIPLPEGSVGSHSGDVIAITLKSSDFTPDEVNQALNLLYSQILNSTNPIDKPNLDIYNIEIQGKDFIIDNDNFTSSKTMNLDLSKIFQLHKIKITKRLENLKYESTYQPHTQAMAKFSEEWDDPNNIATLTDGLYTPEYGNERISKQNLNVDMFQLSVQQILDLELA
jgi:hypothetical protein